LAEVVRPAEGVVIGLARGGVPVAAEVSAALALPLDVLTVRKLGVPDQPELAFGAVASGGHQVLNRDVIEWSRVDPVTIERVRDEQVRVLDQRERAYRPGMAPVDVAGTTVILVDDGLATGATMAVAIASVRARKAARVVVAVPVASPVTCAMVAARAELVVCLVQPEAFNAVGAWYEAFPEVTDDEVRAALRTANGSSDRAERAGP